MRKKVKISGLLNETLDKLDRYGILSTTSPLTPPLLEERGTEGEAELKIS